MVEATATQLLHKTKPRKDLPVCKKDAAERLPIFMGKPETLRVLGPATLLEHSGIR